MPGRRVCLFIRRLYNAGGGAGEASGGFPKEVAFQTGS